MCTFLPYVETNLKLNYILCNMYIKNVHALLRVKYKSDFLFFILLERFEVNIHVALSMHSFKFTGLFRSLFMTPHKGLFQQRLHLSIIMVNHLQ